MAEGLTITLQGWEQLQQAFARAPEIVQEELGAFAHNATQLLRSEVIDRTPVGASGGSSGLRGSITASVDRMADGVLGVVGTVKPYAVPVELGTKPHMPPILPIMEWVQAKFGGGQDMNEIRSRAEAIRWKIYRYGTKGHFMFRDAFQANAGEVQRQFDSAAARIVARISGA